MPSFFFRFDTAIVGGTDATFVATSTPFVAGRQGIPSTSAAPDSPDGSVGAISLGGFSGIDALEMYVYVEPEIGASTIHMTT